MFNIGDLVEFKPSGMQLDYLNPLKRIGVVISIDRGEIKSLWGTTEDRIVVKWMPGNLIQACTSIRLRPVEKE
tara:strand:+ start:485 stop:703 length:219 start_codon:yes stop_codon:yes gene_type:complete